MILQYSYTLRQIIINDWNIFRRYFMCPKLKIRLNFSMYEKQVQNIPRKSGKYTLNFMQTSFYIFQKIFFSFVYEFFKKNYLYEPLLPLTNTFSMSLCLRTSELQRNCNTGAR